MPVEWGLRFGFESLFAIVRLEGALEEKNNRNVSVPVVCHQYQSIND